MRRLFYHNFFNISLFRNGVKVKTKLERVMHLIFVEELWVLSVFVPQVHVDSSMDQLK